MADEAAIGDAIGDAKDVRALATDAVPPVYCCMNAVIELTAVCRTISAVTAISRSHCNAMAYTRFIISNWTSLVITWDPVQS